MKHIHDSFYRFIYVLTFSSSMKLSQCCECQQGSIIENFCRSDIVARVKFVNLTINKTDPGHYYKYNVEYVKIYKKTEDFESIENKNVIYSPPGGGACGYSIDVHSEYNEMAIFALGGAGNNRLVIDICSANSVWNREMEGNLDKMSENMICKFYENNTDLINRYCHSKFVASVKLKDIWKFDQNDTFEETALLKPGRGPHFDTEVDYDKIYKSSPSFEDVKNQSSVGLDVSLKKCLNSHDARNENMVLIGSTLTGRAIVNGCGSVFVWNEEFESKLNNLSNLNCTLALDPTECSFEYVAFYNEWCP